MKKTLNRLLAIVAAITMVFAFGVTAFAAGNGDGIPDSGDTGSITVKNVASGATVTAYKIIEATYGTDEKTFLGWNDLTGKGLVNNGTVDITADKINAIDTTGLETTTLNKTDGDYTANVGAGTYLIKVTGSGTDIYNDMVVSLNYDENGELVADTVDASGNFYSNGDTSNAVAYAKKSEETVDKEYDDPADKSVQVGASVPFTITTTIPSYDTSVTEATFVVTDYASTGLTLPTDTSKYTITVGGNEVKSEQGQATIAVNNNGDNNTFTVTFTSDYIKSLAAKSATERAVVINYNATINANALQTNIGEFDNKAEIKYTNGSGTETSTKTTPTTHEYTFNYNGDGKVARKVRQGETEYEPLSGAEFTIYTDENCTTVLDTDGDAATTEGVCTTGVDGKFYFNGLDEDRTYYIKETKAPAGYSLLTGKMTVKIDPTYTDSASCTGTLESYTITTTDFNGESKSVTYNVTNADSDAADATVTNYSAEANRTDILNTGIPELPSTGGIGTYIFTIIGVAVMVVGAAAIILIVRNRKKTEQ